MQQLELHNGRFWQRLKHHQDYLHARYEYDSITDGESIRLLYIHPGRIDDRIECNLVMRSLDVEEPHFDALSYHWGVQQAGDHAAWGQIRCDGKIKTVTQNLFEALKVMRHPEQTQILWADAVCIDQSNVSERNHQVRLMRRIYQQASRTIVWIGNGPTTDIIGAFRLVCALAQKSGESGNKEPEFFWHQNGKVVADAQQPMENILPVDPRWISLLRLFRQPWFRRLWVIQEVALARTVEMKWGAATIDFTYVGLAAKQIWTSESWSLRWNRCAGDFNAHLIYSIWTGEWTCSFSKLLQRTTQFAVSDDRDRVYGLMGIPSSDAQNDDVEATFLQPDYNLSSEEVYIAVATKLICQLGDLSLLSIIEHHGSTRDEMPSWVPDCRDSARYPLTPIYADDLNRAGMQQAADVRSVQVINPLKSLRNQPDVPAIVVKGIAISVVEWRSRPINPGLSAIHRYESYWAILSELEGCVSVEDSPKRLAWTLCAGRNWLGERICTEEESDCLSTVQKLRNAEKLGRVAFQRHLLDSGRKSDRQFLDRALHSCSGRSFFRTANRLLGLGPGVAEEGDVLCIFFGGPMPYLLRPAGAGKYRFVGECYVYDLMEGQAISQ
jgi:hypothetical protein